ncbi:MAG TPA: phosphatase PAP2 family protein [Gemmatimonadales bacterium]|nr:phosphatase PAP2 family protein [Gemmatimonadales bacterium]
MSARRLALAFGLFVLVTGVAVLPAGHRVDRMIAVWVERAAPGPDVPTASLVFLGDAEVVIPGLAVAGLILLLRRNTRRGRALLWLAGAAAGVSLLAVVLKHLIVHPGPPLALTRPIGRPGLTIHATPYGYPSGHTMRTTLLAGTLLRRMPVLAAVLVAAMMASLVYLGDHWTSEVFGGLCLGWVCVEVTWAVWGGRLRTTRSPNCPRG